MWTSFWIYVALATATFCHGHHSGSKTRADVNVQIGMMHHKPVLSATANAQVHKPNIVNQPKSTQQQQILLPITLLGKKQGMPIKLFVPKTMLLPKQKPMKKHYFPMPETQAQHLQKQKLSPATAHRTSILNNTINVHPILKKLFQSKPMKNSGNQQKQNRNMNPQFPGQTVKPTHAYNHLLPNRHGATHLPVNHGGNIGQSPISHAQVSVNFDMLHSGGSRGNNHNHGHEYNQNVHQHHPHTPGQSVGGTMPSGEHATNNMMTSNQLPTLMLSQGLEPAISKGLGGLHQNPNTIPGSGNIFDTLFRTGAEGIHHTPAQFSNSQGTNQPNVQQLADLIPLSHELLDLMLANGIGGNNEMLANELSGNNEMLANGLSGNNGMLANGLSGNNKMLANGLIGINEMIANGLSGNNGMHVNGPSGNGQHENNALQNGLGSLIPDRLAQTVDSLGVTQPNREQLFDLLQSIAVLKELQGTGQTQNI